MAVLWCGAGLHRKKRDPDGAGVGVAGRRRMAHCHSAQTDRMTVRFSPIDSYGHRGRSCGGTSTVDAFALQKKGAGRLEQSVADYMQVSTAKACVGLLRFI